MSKVIKWPWKVVSMKCHIKLVGRAGKIYIFLYFLIFLQFWIVASSKNSMYWKKVHLLNKRGYYLHCVSLFSNTFFILCTFLNRWLRLRSSNKSNTILSRYPSFSKSKVKSNRDFTVFHSFPIFQCLMQRTLRLVMFMTFLYFVCAMCIYLTVFYRQLTHSHTHEFTLMALYHGRLLILVQKWP